VVLKIKLAGLKPASGIIFDSVKDISTARAVLTFCLSPIWRICVNCTEFDARNRTH